MSSSNPEAKAQQDSQSVQDYDLGYLMAPLSRQRLELVLAKIICKYPDEVEKLLEESRKAADIMSISNEIKTMLEDQGLQILEALPHLEHNIRQVILENVLSLNLLY